MQQLTNITDEPKQEMNVRLDNGDIITLRFEYVASQLGWYLDIIYNDFESTFHRITNCPNMIRQWRRILPFGIACTVKEESEPYFIDDFKNGRASFYVLSESDVQYVENTFYKGE